MAAVPPRSVRARHSAVLLTTAFFGACLAARPAHAQAVPSPWVARDVGTASPAGSTTWAAGVFTVQAGGKDIGGSSDQFQFVYQPITGDVDVIARVDSIADTDAGSKAGVMIRASLSSGAANGYVGVSAANGTNFQRRAQSGGLTTTVHGQAATAPQWVKVSRQGATVTGYSSADGVTWTRIASATLALNASAYVGLAVTSHSSGALTTAALSKVVVNTASLPGNLLSRDIGSPTIAGKTSYADGAFTITAGGSDIWGTADQFHFGAYQAIAGDVEIVARIASITRASSWSKAGVMIREALTSSSTHASTFLSAGNGYVFQRRTSSGGFSDNTFGATGAAPGWVRLVRTGSRFDSYQSVDGKSWTLIGSDTIPMASTVYVGLAVTSHNTSTATQVVADSLTVTSAAQNQQPTITLTAPASAAGFTAPADIAISASASDPENRMDRVEFYNGTTRIGTASAAPYAMTWTGVAAGTYSIQAMAFDLDGGSATSNVSTVTVNTAANKPPAVSLTAPTSTTVITAPSTVTISAAASDPEGRMSKVEFYAGSTLVGTATSSPYSASWAVSAAGSYVLKAIAYDRDGGQTTSSSVTVTVGAASTAPTKVTFTASADHASVTSYRLDVFLPGVDPATATPTASSSLGKPTPDATNTITVDRASFFSALAPGTYQATVSAVGAGGESRSAAITFTR